MRLSRDFIRAWYAWLRTPLPTSNFRLGKSEAPSYGIELQLAHLQSDVYSLGESAIAGRDHNYASLCAEYLSEIEAIRLELRDCELPDGRKEELAGFAHATHELLAHLSKVKSM